MSCGFVAGRERTAVYHDAGTELALLGGTTPERTTCRGSELIIAPVRSSRLGDAPLPLARVRALEPSDVAGLSALHEAVFGERACRAALVRFLTDVFFRHPWRAAGVESLGCVDEAGTLVGCLGVMPRPMVFGGRRLRVLVTHNFMMHPSHRSGLAAIRLLKAVLDTEPDLVLAEGNRTAKSLCEALGGRVIDSRSERWVKVLRPVGLGAHLLGRRLPPSLAAMLRRVTDLTHASSVAERAAARHVTGTSDAETNGTLLAEHVNEYGGPFELRPVYTPSTATWLLECLRRTSRDQTLRARHVHRAGEIVGWYVYYSRPHEVGRVLQLGAREDARRVVLQRLVVDALEQDNVALTGATDPWWRPELEAMSCRFRPGRSWLLAHARADDLLDVVESRRTFLSRLEGEGWLRFGY